MNSATELERLLKLGISAYQQGEYSRAIASLSRLCRSESRPYQTKGYVGLVRVYMTQKNWPQAKKICQKLSASSSPLLQQWSQETLEKISERMAASACQTASPVKASPVKNPKFNGFQLLNQSLAGEPISELPTCKPVDSHRETDDSGSSSSDVSIPQASVFHYASLNADLTAESTDEAETIEKERQGKDPEEDSVEKDPREKDSQKKEGLEWIYADRLSQGRALGQIRSGQLWFAQIGGAIAFFLLWLTGVYHSVALANIGLGLLARHSPLWVRSLPGRWQDAASFLLIALSVLAIASPWLWDLWLQLTARRQPCPATLLRSHSAEAVALLGRQCRQRNWPFPTLWKLPTDIPLIFSYGWLPRNARLVISQGLLTQLKDDEIAALVAYEISGWKSWHWRFLSVTGLIWQVLLWLYWQSALWGNRQNLPVKTFLGIVATLAYSLFWLSRLPALCMARVRTYYSDRAATVTSGNPNGLTRALAKLSFGLAASIEQQGYTPVLIESLTPLLPVSADLSRQHLYGQLPLVSLFAWDIQNPLRVWMSCMNPHPPLGDRFRLLMAYAQHWKLTPEIQIHSLKQRRQGLSLAEWKQLARQGTPYLGMAVGLMIGLALLGIGAISAAFEWPMLDWMHNDLGLFQCCWLLGTGIGIVLRLNRFFPDLSFSMPFSPSLATWASNPNLLPASSIPVKLSGILLGRPGIANWLGQDLLLKTHLGAIKLHYFSALGPLGNRISLVKTPLSINRESVQILGWYRRGNQSWIDIDKIRLDSGSFLRAAHPVYSLLIAMAASGIGLWLLVRSNSYG
ncbi:MAG: M48 family metalloprotease [Phormidesmis sp.]